MAGECYLLYLETRKFSRSNLESVEWLSGYFVDWHQLIHIRYKLDKLSDDNFHS